MGEADIKRLREVLLEWIRKEYLQSLDNTERLRRLLREAENQSEEEKHGDTCFYRIVWT